MIGAEFFDSYTRAVLYSLSTPEELSSVEGCGYVLMRIGVETLQANNALQGAISTREHNAAKKRLETLRAIRVCVKNHRHRINSARDIAKPFAKHFIAAAKEILSDDLFAKIQLMAVEKLDAARARQKIVMANVGNVLPMSGSGASAPRRHHDSSRKPEASPKDGRQKATKKQRPAGEGEPNRVEA